MFEDVEDAAVVDAISTSARAENAACARRLAAVAELYKRRQIPVEDGNGRELWRIDPWEAVAAEVAAAQCITPAAASAQLHWATCLDERLPKVAAVFATGEISLRTAKIIIARTLLAIDPDVLAGIDAEIADTITGWGPMSVDKTERAVDVIVTRRDPAARRRTADRVRSRHFTIDTTPNGQTTSIWGELYSTDATLLDRRLTAMAHQVCEADPRTVEQRRADALGALAAGQTRLTCACGGSTCGATPSVAPSGVVVHVVAEAASLDAATAATDDPDARGIHRSGELASTSARSAAGSPATARGRHRRPRHPNGIAHRPHCAGRRDGPHGYSPGRRTSRAALPTFRGARRLRALPRLDVPLPRLPTACGPLRSRPHRAI
jgi:hypothetical protein